MNGHAGRATERHGGGMFSVIIDAMRSERSATVATAAVLIFSLVACTDVSTPIGVDAPSQRAASPVALDRQSAPIADQYIITFAGDVDDVPGLAKKLIDDANGTALFTYTTAIKGFA